MSRRREFSHLAEFAISFQSRHRSFFVLQIGVLRFPEQGPNGGVYLLRVIIDLWPDGPEIVTAYKTSRIDKYWKGVR